MKSMIEAWPQIEAFVRMRCEQLGYNGVFSMTQFEPGVVATNGVIMWTQVRNQSVLKLNRPDGKRDSNSLCNSLPKVGMVIAHRRHTGNPTNITGELPYLGGRISKDGRFGYAFSGATSEQDDELMQEVEEYHASL